MSTAICDHVQGPRGADGTCSESGRLTTCSHLWKLTSWLSSLQGRTGFQKSGWWGDERMLTECKVLLGGG